MVEVEEKMAKIARLTAERDALRERAEKAEAEVEHLSLNRTAGYDMGHKVCQHGKHVPCVDCQRNEINALRAERDDLLASAALRAAADERAIKRWRQATGRVMVLPDHADLCVWLLGELARVRGLALKWESRGKLAIAVESLSPETRAALREKA